MTHTHRRIVTRDAAGMERGECRWTSCPERIVVYAEREETSWGQSSAMKQMRAVWKRNRCSECGKHHTRTRCR